MPPRRTPLRLLTVVAIAVALAPLLFMARAQAPGRPAAVPALAQAEETAADSAAAPAVRVVGRVPLPGEAWTGEVVVFFDAPLADHAGGIRIEGVAGETRVRGNALVFAPERVPNQGVYRVELAPRFANGGQLAAEARTFSITPQVFRATRLFDGGRARDAYRLGLAFSHPVDDAAVQDVLTVRDARGEVAGWEVKSTSDERVVRVHVPLSATPPLRVSLAPGLPSADGALQRTEVQELSAQAVVLAVESAKLERVNADEDELVLNFNSRVAPDALQAALSLTLEGEPVQYEVLHATAAQSLGMRIRPALPPGAQVKLRLEPLASHGLARPMEAPYETTLTLDLDELELQYVGWDGYDLNGVSLRLNFSHSVGAAEVAEYLSLEPEPEEWTVEAGDYSREVYVEAPFSTGETYTVRVAAGLVSPDARARVATEQRRTSAAVPEVHAVGFGYEGKIFFPRRSGSAIGVEGRNLQQASITAHRLFPTNLPVALHESRRGTLQPYQVEQWGAEVHTTKLAFPRQPDTVVTSALDLDAFLKGRRKGVYALTAQAQPSGYANKLIVWTDLGVLAQWQDDAIALYVHDLFTLEPVAGATVTVYSQKNQPLVRTQTRNDGTLIVDQLDTYVGTPYVAVVETEEDFTFLALEAESDDVGGDAAMPRYARDDYDAFIYGDRELYRPGETVHLHWLVRQAYGPSAGSVPLQLQVRKPDGSVLVEEAVTLSARGTGGFDLDTASNYPTGAYTATLAAPGAELPAGRYIFSLEDFVPARMRAEVSATPAVVQPGQEVAVRVAAEHLYGGAATDRRAEADVILSAGTYTPPGWDGFRFENSDEKPTEVVQLGEGTTDGDGVAAFTYTYRVDDAPTQPLQATIRGRVFELGGRPVTARSDAMIVPADTMLGIALESSAEGVAVTVAAVRPDGSPAGVGEVEVVLERETWRYFVRRLDGYNEPNWTRTFAEVERHTVALSEGRGTLTLPARGWGQYRVRVRSAETPLVSDAHFYAMGGTAQVIDGARPQLVSLEAEAESVAVGEQVAVRIGAPFDGLAVCVLQGEGFHRVVTLPVTDGAAVLRFTAETAHVPGVWVSTTVLHQPRSGTAEVYPYSSFATLPIQVTQPEHTLQVALPALPAEVLPAQEQRFTVVVSDAQGAPVQGAVTLAAVDEGIHLITGYASPDPVAWLWRTRRPAHHRAHYYDQVAYDFEAPPIGGGMATRLEDTPNVGESWIQPVALWSGTVETNAEGRAEVTFALPEFNGELRLVAVAATEQAVGSTSAPLKVRRPYILQTSLPRFVRNSDAFEATAVVRNTTDEAVQAVLTASAQGDSLQGGGRQTFDLAAGAEFSCRMAFEAGDRIAAAAVEWQLEVRDAAGNALDSVSSTQPLPVQATAAYQQARSFHEVAPGASREVSAGGYRVDSRLTQTVTVTADPLWQLRGALADLVAYPYGCAEQTTSRLMPLLLVREYEGLAGSVLDEASNADAYLRAGIERLLALQNASGGFGFWPGSSTDAYTSIYAGHFLALAHTSRAAEVPEAALESLRRYLQNVGTNWTQGPDASFERAYATYVLALLGDPIGLSNLLRFDGRPLSDPSRYLLAAAVIEQTNDTALANRFLAGTSERVAGGAFASSARDAALELIGLVGAGAPAARVQPRVDLLREVVQAERANTHERAMACTALALYLRNLQEGDGDASARIAGPSGDATLRGMEVYRDTVSGEAVSYTVTNEGGRPLYVYFDVAGVPSSPNLETVAEGLRIERTLRTLRGEALGADTPLVQGQSYLVTLTLDVDAVNREHVVIDDRLPGGLEVENPRLQDDALAGLDVLPATAPDHVEVRDDRLVVAYERLGAGRHRFHYAVRAVTPGAFQQPGVIAECMYDAAVRAAQPAARVAVAPPGN